MNPSRDNTTAIAFKLAPQLKLLFTLLLLEISSWATPESASVYQDVRASTCDIMLQGW